MGRVYKYMSWLNREYGVDTERKMVDKLGSGWHNIEQKTEGYQRKVTITNNTKRWAIVFTIMMLFFVYIFLIIGHNYSIFILISCLFIPPQIGSFSKKTCIIKSTTDNSIIVRKQAILKNETIIYKNVEKPYLKLFKFPSIIGSTYTDKSLPDHFALAIISSDKITLLRFQDPAFPFYYGSPIYYGIRWYDTILMLNDREEAENISTFLSLPLLNEIGDLEMLKKERGSSV